MKLLEILAVAWLCGSAAIAIFLIHAIRKDNPTRNRES